MRYFLLLICLQVLSPTVHAQSKQKGLLKHVVIMTFKSDADAKTIASIDASFAKLSTLPMVKGYEWGVVPSAASPKQVQHVYVTYFKDAKSLENYGKSPQHLAHIKLGADQVLSVQAVDYIVE